MVIREFLTIMRTNLIFCFVSKLWRKKNWKIFYTIVSMNKRSIFFLTILIFFSNYFLDLDQHLLWELFFNYFFSNVWITILNLGTFLNYMRFFINFFVLSFFTVEKNMRGNKWLSYLHFLLSYLLSSL